MPNQRKSINYSLNQIAPVQVKIACRDLAHDFLNGCRDANGDDNKYFVYTEATHNTIWPDKYGKCDRSQGSATPQCMNLPTKIRTAATIAKLIEASIKYRAQLEKEGDGTAEDQAVEANRVLMQDLRTKSVPGTYVLSGKSGMSEGTHWGELAPMLVRATDRMYDDVKRGAENVRVQTPVAPVDTTRVDAKMMQENNKSKNRIILENHRKNKNVHPAAKDNWWFDA